MILKQHQYYSSGEKLNIEISGRISAESGAVDFYLVFKKPCMLHNSESLFQNYRNYLNQHN